MKGPRRSKLNLVRKVYFKIIDKNKEYFLLERAYASECDGYIQVDLIKEETYLKAVERNERTKELEFDDARPNLQHQIKSIA